MEKVEEKLYACSRSAPLDVEEFVQGLSEEKLCWVKEIGLGGLLELRLESNRNKEVIELIKRFNFGTRELFVHSQKIVLTNAIVGDIMGLRSGGKGVTKGKCKSGKILVEYKPGGYSRNEIVKMLRDETHKEKWKVNFALLANHCILRPSSSLLCYPNSYEFLENLDILNQMNWCKFVLDGLCDGVKDLQSQLKGINDGKRKSVNLKG